MIGFTAAGSYGSPSYRVVHMFSNNLGAKVVGTRLTGAAGIRQVVTKTVQNGRTTFYVKVVNASRRGCRYRPTRSRYCA